MNALADVAWPGRPVRERGAGAARARRLLAVAAIAAAPLASAQVIDIAWDAQGRLRRDLRAEPGKFVELCGRLSPGTKVQWRFEASATTNFNVHYHVAKDVRYPVKEDAVRKSQGTLEVAVEQEYCWMWSNKGPAPAEIAVEMSKGG